MEAITKPFGRRSFTCRHAWAGSFNKALGCVLGFWCLNLRVTVAAEAPAYYELRIYDVTTNKLDAVLERFRDTVEPVRRKHGINTLGYWTASTTNGEKFVYLIEAASKEQLQEREKEFGADPQFQKGYAASNQEHGKTVDAIRVLPLNPAPEAKFDFTGGSASRAFELRIYSVLPGKLEPFAARWRDFAVPVYERHELHSIGWWISERKDGEGHDQFVCLLAGDSPVGIQQSIDAFHGDAEWKRVESEIEREGKLRGTVETLKMSATDFSRLR
jgi:hypothetical protein